MVKSLKFLTKAFGLLILIVLSYYFFLFWMQSREVEKVCASVEVNQELTNFELFENNTWLTIRKPYIDEESKTHIVLCSSATLCEDFCEIIIVENEIVGKKLRK